MPYETPSAAQFKTRHPSFAEVDSDYIDAIIVDANRNVDTSWLEDDYEPAIMYLAAHMMICEGQLGGSQMGVLASEKMGDAAASYDNSAPSVSDFGSTSYGRRYLELLRLNHPGVVTTDQE